MFVTPNRIPTPCFLRNTENAKREQMRIKTGTTEFPVCASFPVPQTFFCEDEQQLLRLLIVASCMFDVF